MLRAIRAREARAAGVMLSARGGGRRPRRRARRRRDRLRHEAVLLRRAGRARARAPAHARASATRRRCRRPGSSSTCSAARSRATASSCACPRASSTCSPTSCATPTRRCPPADPERRVGLRLRPRHERGRGLRALPAAQARAARPPRADRHAALGRLPPHDPLLTAMARATDTTRLGSRVPGSAACARGCARDRGDPRRCARRRRSSRPTAAPARRCRRRSTRTCAGGERVRAEDPRHQVDAQTRRRGSRSATSTTSCRSDLARALYVVRVAGGGIVTQPAGADSAPGARRRDVAGPQPRERRGDARLRTAPLGFSDVHVNGEPCGSTSIPVLRDGRRVALDRRRRADRGRHARAERRRAHVPVRRHGDAAGGARLGFAFATRLSRPLRRMATTAAEVRAGDLSPRIGAGAAATTRCACWRTRSTACSTGSRTRSRASAASSPTPRTSCARR